MSQPPDVIFLPTRPPAGRLVRLGVVLDTRMSWERFALTARLCDGAGIDALWVRESWPPGNGPRLDAWTALTRISREAPHARLGAIAELSRHEAPTIAALATTLIAAAGSRVEITLTAESAGAPERARDHMLGLRAAGVPVALAIASRAELGSAAKLADNVVLPAMPTMAAIDLIGHARSACADGGRDPRSLGIAMELPVSVGRTTAEAQARANAESLFQTIGDPRTVGLFGTLEQCQDRVIELAHAGITDLRCVLPDAADLHDVIAQLTAISIGTTDVLLPGSAKSKAPDPPTSWGGRTRG